MATQNSENSCICLPYNDGLVIMAQVLSFVALLLSWNVITEIFGLTAFVFLQIMWCCKMKKCGLVMVGVFTLIAAIAGIVIGLWSLALHSDTFCDDLLADFNSYDAAESSSSNNITSTTTNNPVYVNNTANAYDIDMHYCTLGLNMFAGVSLASGALWLIITFCIFYFTCGNRYQESINYSSTTQKKDDVERADISKNSSGITTIVVDEDEDEDEDKDERKKNGPEEIRNDDAGSFVVGDIV